MTPLFKCYNTVNVDRLDVHHCEDLSDKMLESLTQTPTGSNLRFLTLKRCGPRLTEKGFSLLAQLARLQGLCLGAKRKPFRDGHLLKLFPGGCMGLITENCKDLRELEFHKFSMKDEDFRHIAVNLVHLRVITLSYINQITNASLVHFARNCKRLQAVTVRNCSGVSDEGVLYLVYKCRKSLREVHVADCGESLLTCGFDTLLRHEVQAVSLRLTSIALCRCHDLGIWESSLAESRDYFWEICKHHFCLTSHF